MTPKEQAAYDAFDQAAFEAEVAVERYYEGGWDPFGRYAAEDEEDLRRAIAVGNACGACGSVVHVQDADGLCYRTRQEGATQ
jgi:hypothetical protein